MFNKLLIQFSGNAPTETGRGLRYFDAANREQNGSSLIVALVLLVILTMLGLTSMQIAGIEERMAGNTRDRSLAFQAAEAALRDAERDVKCEKIDGKAATVSRLIGCISGMTGADDKCTDGLCCNISGLVCVEPATPVHRNTTLSLSKTPSIRYGTYTDAPLLSGIDAARQPRYLVEPFVKNSSNYYRITARGYGLNANTMVTLQEVYKE